jgi:hypothetical protein
MHTSPTPTTTRRMIMVHFWATLLITSIVIATIAWFGLSYPFISLFGKTQIGFSERFEFILGVTASFFSLVTAWNLRNVVGARGEFWAPWRYLAYGLFIYAIAGLVHPILYVIGATGATSLLIAVALMYACYPIVTIVGVRRFLRAAQKKMIIVSLPGILLWNAIFQLILFALAMRYQPALGWSVVAGIGLAVGVFINATIGLAFSVRYVGGALRKDAWLLVAGMIPLAIGSSQELLFAFIGYSSELYEFFIYDLHINRPFYVLSALLLLYASTRMSADVIAAHSRESRLPEVDAPAPATATASTSTSAQKQPYPRMAQAIIHMYVSIVGVQVSIAQLSAVDGLRVDERGRIISSSMKNEQMVKQVIRSHMALLGDSAYDFADIAARPIIERHKDVRFPSRDSVLS